MSDENAIPASQLVSGASPLDYRSDQPARKPILFRPWFVLCIILLLAVMLRWLAIGEAGLWLDEFLSVQNSTGRGQLHVKLPRDVVFDPAPALSRLHDGPGIWAIWSSLDTETHPPLYLPDAPPFQDVETEK